MSDGELLLRGEAGAHRLLAGELLVLRGPLEVSLSAGRGGGEALVLQASPEWVARVRALFGATALDACGDPLVREMAGTERARRAGRLLLAAHLDGAPFDESGGPAIGAASRWIELVGIAGAITGSLVAPRRPAGARSRSRRAVLVRALEALDGGDLEGFSLGVLAERLGVSRRHASRLLREELGTSLPEYLCALRIERAKKLLAHTEDAVTEIAFRTGWQSLSHFNTTFRRRVGATPSQYRAQALGAFGGAERAAPDDAARF